MIKRGLALGLVLGVTSAAMADVAIDLRPVASGSASPFDLCGQYGPSESITVEVYVTQTGGSDLLIRMAKMDFDGGDVFPAGIAWDGTNADLTHHYQYSSGNTHAIVHAGPLPPNPAPGPGDLGPNAATQYNLPGAGEVKVGELTVNLPAADGPYMLSAVTAVHYGFGLTDGPITSEAGTAEVALAVGAQNVTAAAPDTQQSLWRSANNTIRITFDTAILAPAPGDIEIVELQAGGTTGADISGSFAYTVEPGNILRIRESGTALSNGSWYEIRNLGGWADAGPFRVQYQMALGDANIDGRALPNDLSAINTDVPNLFAADDSRFDINGDGRVLPDDLSAANSNVPYLGVAKPSGHDCN